MIIRLEGMINPRLYDEDLHCGGDDVPPGIMMFRLYEWGVLMGLPRDKLVVEPVGMILCANCRVSHVSEVFTQHSINKYHFMTLSTLNAPLPNKSRYLRKGGRKQPPFHRTPSTCASPL